eukprot:661119-Rhodomonas_salina.1
MSKRNSKLQADLKAGFRFQTRTLVSDSKMVDAGRPEPKLQKAAAPRTPFTLAPIPSTNCNTDKESRAAAVDFAHSPRYCDPALTA